MEEGTEEEEEQIVATGSTFDDAWNRVQHTTAGHTDTVHHHDDDDDDDDGDEQFRQYVQWELQSTPQSRFRPTSTPLSVSRLQRRDIGSRSGSSGSSGRRRNSASDLLDMMRSAPSPIGGASPADRKRAYGTFVETGHGSILFDSDDDADDVSGKRTKVGHFSLEQNDDHNDDSGLQGYDELRDAQSVSRHSAGVDSNERDIVTRELERTQQELRQVKLKSSECSIQLDTARKQNEIFQTQLEQLKARDEQREEKEERLIHKIEQLEKQLTQSQELLASQQQRTETSDASQASDDYKLTSSALQEQLIVATNRIKRLEYEVEQDVSGVKKLKIQLAEKERELLEVHSACAALKTELAHQKIEVETMQSQLHVDQVKSRQLESQLQSKDDFLVINQQLRDELAKLQGVEKRNRQLLREKKEYFKKLENVEILKEQIMTLQEQNNRIEILEKEKDDLEKQREQFEREWAHIFEQQSVSDVGSEFKRLQAENVRYAEEFARYKTDNVALQDRVRQCDEKCDGMQKELISLKEDLKQHKQRLVDRESDIVLLEQRLEREKTLLNSYSQEHAVMKGESPQFERITELEKTVTEKDQEIKSLKDRLQQIQSETSESSKQIQQEVYELRRSVEVLIQERDSAVAEKQELSRERDTLEQEMKKLNDYNRETTKVLHLKINPETQARANRSEETVETLKARNKILEHKLEKLQQQQAQHQGSQGYVDTAAPHNLREKLEESEKRMLRLKEAFHSKINEFRTVIYLLFGYRVDLIRESEYRLSPMYAEEEHDHLVFKYAKARAATTSSSSSSPPTVHLLDTEFTINKVKSDTMDHLKTYGSIPAFLSLLTLDLFNQQTVFGGGSGSIMR